MSHQKPTMEEEPNKIIPLPIDSHSAQNTEEGIPQKQHQTAEIVSKDPHGRQVTTALSSPPTDRNQEVQDKLFKIQTPLHPHSQQIPENAQGPKENASAEVSHNRASNENVANPLPNRQAVDPHLSEIPYHQDRFAENMAHPIEPQFYGQVDGYYQTHPPIRMPRRDNRMLCPFWLKILTGLIVISLICAILFWCYFRYRGTPTIQKQTLIQERATIPREAIEAIPENLTETLVKISKAINPPTKTVTTEVKTEPSSKPKAAVDNPKLDVIILVRGHKTECPSDQLLVNGNCLVCEPGEEWFGLHCIPSPDHHRHMRRRHY